MTPSDLRHHLAGKEQDSVETLAFLVNEFVPDAVQRMNEEKIRKRMALYAGDRIPENERNLTDSRNRISLLIEYLFAQIINNILADYQIADWFCSCVVANRFPDLDLRDTKGSLGLRFEVKCLQSIAEEKSANFDTLKKDINPHTDYVIVFLWEWSSHCTNVHWDRAPHILKAFVFHAFSLAEIRDYKWLNSPPKPSLPENYQGYDLRYAVSYGSDGTYHKEEGNFGKLMRIWHPNMTYHLTMTSILQDTIAQHRLLDEKAILSGFESLVTQIFGIISENKPMFSLCHSDGNQVGIGCDNLGFVLKRHVTGKEKEELLSISQRHKLHHVVVMNDKYASTLYHVNASTLDKLNEFRKPRKLITHLSES